MLRNFFLPDVCMKFLFLYCYNSWFLSSKTIFFSFVGVAGAFGKDYHVPNIDLKHGCIWKH